MVNNMVKIDNLGTEKRNPKTENLDSLSTLEILQIINEEDQNVLSTIKDALPNIDRLVQECIKAYNNGGRIIYVGAGTSGRLGLMDAVEVVPTYNSDRFVGLIAGGEYAFVRAVEGAEDSKQLCVNDLKNINFNEKDILIGIAASGRTPYVIGGIEYAKQLGAVTGCVCCNYDSQIAKLVDYPVEVNAGPEVVTGSTRMKAGTCQKIILNMISTCTMIGVGKVYKNLMIDVRPTNEKLIERCRNIVMGCTGCDHDTADKVLNETENNTKLAVTMILFNKTKQEAMKALEEANGVIRNIK